MKSCSCIDQEISFCIQTYRILVSRIYSRHMYICYSLSCWTFIWKSLFDEKWGLVHYLANFLDDANCFITEKYRNDPLSWFTLWNTLSLVSNFEASHHWEIIQLSVQLWCSTCACQIKNTVTNHRKSCWWNKSFDIFFIPDVGSCSSW